jgi:N-acetylmuramoyl-L-alanine amidase
VTKIYVAPGHGITPSGSFDPGAVSGHEVEHTLARAVVTVYANALRRSGWVVVEETEPDPDYIGSVSRANAAGVACGDEVHFNAGGGHGVEILVHPNTSPANRSCAARMCTLVSQATGLPFRGVVNRSDLYWLNGTNFPATLPEIAFVDADQAIIDSPGFADQVGEALARARCEYMGLPYKVPGIVPVTPPAPPSPATTKPNCTAIQQAVHTIADNLWGSETDKHCDAVIAATPFGGSRFPYGISYTQRAVGTIDDGWWGSMSKAALTRTVLAMQSALLGMGFDPQGIDGIWGPHSNDVYARARTACHI